MTTDLTPEERKIVKARTDWENAESVAVEKRATFRQGIAQYLEGGGSPTRIGKILGLTRGRIYQYRDAAYNDRELAG